LLYAVPFFVLSLSLEWWLVRKGKLEGSYATQDALTSMLMGLGNLASDILMGAISLAILIWAWQFKIFDWGISLPIIILALIAQDFLYYWKHRAAHRIRWFWTAHVTRLKMSAHRRSRLSSGLNISLRHRDGHMTDRVKVPRISKQNMCGKIRIWPVRPDCQATRLKPPIPIRGIGRVASCSNLLAI